MFKNSKKTDLQKLQIVLASRTQKGLTFEKSKWCNLQGNGRAKLSQTRKGIPQVLNSFLSIPQIVDRQFFFSHEVDIVENIAQNCRH